MGFKLIQYNPLYNRNPFPDKFIKKLKFYLLIWIVNTTTKNAWYPGS